MQLSYRRVQDSRSLPDAIPGLPMIFTFRSQAEAGGLMAYMADEEKLAGRVGSLAARILKGAKPLGIEAWFAPGAGRPLPGPRLSYRRAFHNRSTTLGRPSGGVERRVERGEKWSGRADLNGRPPAPKAGALPGCATPRRAYPTLL
jgi:hypothetical protein